MTTSETSPEKPRGPFWRNEIGGALSGAFVAFSVAVPVGTLTLAPLGLGFAGTGVAAGLVGTAVGGLAACLAGGTNHLRSGPVTAVALVVNALIAALLVLPGMRASTAAGLPPALTFAFLCVTLAGLLQMLFGVLRLGNAIRFVPRPVLAGFRNGIALVIAATQLPILLGLSRPIWRYDAADLIGAAHPWNVTVGAVTVASILLARRSRFTATALFAGLILGTVSHHALRLFLADGQLGATIGALPALHDLPAAWRTFAGLFVDGGLRASALTVAPAIGVALVGSVLSLLAAQVVSDVTRERSDSNRELVGQGLGNVVSGLFGGAPIGGSPSPSMASYRGGARTR